MLFWGEFIENKKALKSGLFVKIRGLERIRTAVEAFAELCLATRPQDHLMWCLSYKINTKNWLIKDIL